MSIIDWEVGLLFWKRVDAGRSHMDAADDVKRKFFEELCSDDKDTHFFVGTPLAYPNSWMILGVYYPKVHYPKVELPSLFD